MSETNKADKSQVETKLTHGLSYRKAMLGAFIVEPEGVKFETQDDSEQVLLFLRQHPVTNMGWIFAVIILVFIPVFISPVIISSGLLSAQVPLGLYIILPLVWYLGTFGYAFTSFLYWYFNIYIVTNKRIVDIDWLNLLFRQVSSAQIEKIQDVTYKMGGILDSFFNFGSVFIQTAGPDPNFEFEAVPNPERVVRKINELLGKPITKEGKPI